MVNTKCGSCYKMTEVGFICPACTQTLLDALANVPEMLTQLQVAVTRQSRFSAMNSGPASGETPVTFNAAASRVSAQYVSTILEWQAKLADQMNPPRGPHHTRPPYRIVEPVRFVSPIAAAVWCWNTITDRGVASWVSAGKMVAALVKAEADASEAVDRPLPREYLGDCTLLDEDNAPCDGRVYATSGEVYGVCDTCKGHCDAEEQRLKLLVWLDERVLTAAEIARTSTYLGLTINREQVRKRINQWHHRKRLTAVTHVDTAAELGEEIDPETADHAGHAPTFRFKDVRLLLEADEDARDRRTRPRDDDAGNRATPDDRTAAAFTNLADRLAASTKTERR